MNSDRHTWRGQIEMSALQDWLKEKGLRAMVVFEGRDAAGKGGTIKLMTEPVSPRAFRLPAAVRANPRADALLALG